MALLASFLPILVKGQALPGSASLGIAISAPANASTVSGNVVVTARAFANLGIANVQFFVDGVAIGPALSTAPYTLNWNSGLVSNGGHALSGVVKDTGGHQATALVNVTVSNAAPPVVSITLGPGSAALSGSQAQQFTATVTGTSNTGVSWSINPAVGTISNGLYTAPVTIASAQNIVVTAASQADPSKTATANLSLTPPPAPVTITLAPGNASLSASQTKQFTATVTGSGNTGVSWTLSPPVGSIASGLYTAPTFIATQENVTVTATSNADVTKSATATISLNPTVTITLGPASVSLAASGTQQFTATVTGSSNTGVSWTLSPSVGTISSGLYTAPSTIASAQSVTVTATSNADVTKSATATISLNPTVTITLGPANASLSASGTQQFAATVTGSGNTGVSWTLSPPVGTISNGLYTAPSTIASAQSVTVTATSNADVTKSATATISLNPTVTITLGPANASLSASGTQQFAATVTGSGNTGVSYILSPPLGTISSTGLYTAPATISTAQNVMLTATSLADAAKTAAAVIALAMSPGSAPLSISINAPANASTVSGNTAISATASSGASSVQFYVDRIAIGSPVTAAPYSVSWNSQSVPDGAHTLSAVAQDSSGDRTTATVSVTVSNTPAIGPVTLPVEVIGPDGYTVTTQVQVPQVPSGALRLWLQIHGLRSQAQASVQVNTGAWIPINETTATLLGQASAFGGIGGGFHTLTMTLNLPQGAVTAGTNSISFRFNGTDGNVSGFRVLGFNFAGPDGTSVLPPQTFVNEDPNTWQPPSTLASDIAAGKSLWYTAALTVPTPSGPAPIQANCTSCHAQDGRDLKYFNYSNNSIRSRALFHGLTAQQGDQIASYIRSLNTPNPGRPWNPPYQPGPGLDSQPVEQWSAGAGLSAVANSDQDVFNAIFPNGVQEATFAATGNLNVRETPIALQLPDWNSWLPTIHPLDAWGASFANSKFYDDYQQLRSILRYGDPIAYANAHQFFMVWPGNFQDFIIPLTPNPGANPDPNYWNPTYINKVYSTPLWAMVKSWELNQEFGLEGMAKTVFTNPLADSRAWDSEYAFLTSPNMNHIPRGLPGLQNGRIPTFIYVAFIWYHTQLILNNSNHQQVGSSPIDWPYVYAFIYDIANSVSPGQTGLLYLWTIKGLQISNSGLGPDSGWNWQISVPSTQVEQDAKGSNLWSDVSATTRAALYEGQVRAFLDVVEKFTPQQFYQGGAASPTVAPVPGQNFGAFGDRVWYAIPLLHYYGLSQGLTDEFAAWAQTVWPAVDWSVTTHDTCYPGNSGAICSTQN